MQHIYFKDNYNYMRYFYVYLQSKFVTWYLVCRKISRSSIWFCYTLGLLNWLLFYTWKSLIFLYCFSTVFNERSNYISCWAVNEMSDCRRNAYMFMLHRCDAFYITTYGGVCWWLTFTQLYDTGTWNTHDDKLSTHETCLKIKHWKVWENI